MLKLTSGTILKNRQDACSTRKFTIYCGTGILPVHKKLIDNGATSELKPISVIAIRNEAIAEVCDCFVSLFGHTITLLQDIILTLSTLKSGENCEPTNRNSQKLDVRQLAAG
ncbi:MULTISPECIES: hypothetical protein [unclassified Microcoleus]|uniref:hypothetical protein n=1 Tax=unclassified Microcoleus TaxID=2642155 RepID=UPI002FD32F09